MRVLGKETEAGVNGLHVADFRGADHPIDLQIALIRLGRTDAVGLVGQLEVLSAAIRLTVDGHGLDAHLTAGAHDAQGDLSAVGD